MDDLFESFSEPNEQEDKDIFSVSRLNFEVRSLLELSLPSIWIEGEISNLAQPKSGHLYFTLKDEKSQVRCVMFRGQNLRLSFKPENGQQVLLRASLGVYEARGDFQLNVQQMQEYGDGLLRRQFEELKNTLQQQGWFADEHKKPLPELPSTIGVISSASGAAIHDILSTLRLRFPAISVIIYPVVVQGRQAAKEIASAIKMANHRAECEVLIVGRGGGSLEDLAAFNERLVAQAIYESNIVVVSAVGHESDISIADLVADYRAATPTAAAQILSPEQAIYRSQINKFERQLKVQVNNMLRLKQALLGTLSGKLPKPANMLSQFAQRTDELEQRLNTSISYLSSRLQSKLTNLSIRLKLNHPATQLAQNQQAIANLKLRLSRVVKQSHIQHRLRLQSAARNLNALSPLAVLGRGYSIVQDQAGKIIKSSQLVKPGDTIDVRLAEGKLQAYVKKAS